MVAGARVWSPIVGDREAERGHFVSSADGARRDLEREDAPAARLVRMLSVQVEEQFCRSPAEQSGANDVREPVLVMPHPAKTVEEGERIGRSGDIPFVVERFTDPSRQSARSEHNHSLAVASALSGIYEHQHQQGFGRNHRLQFAGWNE